MNNVVKQSNVSIIIPAFNEEENLPETLNDYIDNFLELNKSGYRLTVVCNGCTDNTSVIAHNYSRKNSQIAVIDILERIGKGGAIKKGIQIADGDIVGYVDADGSIKARELWKLIQIAIQGKDVVIGSRRVKGAQITVNKSLKWRFASNIHNLLTRILFQLPFRDTQCGAKVLRRRVVKRLINEFKINGMTFDIELLWKAKRQGFEILEIPIIWEHKLKRGATGDLLRTSTKMLFDMIKLRLVP